MNSEISKKDFRRFKKAEWCWVIDPLDGTNNYLNGLDYYSVCIALAHRGKICLGLVYRPSNGDCYFAEENNKASLTNLKTLGRKKTIKRDDLLLKKGKNISDCLLVTGFSAKKGESLEKEFEKFACLLQKCRGIRRMGSAALDLCLVAEGKLDAFWEIGLSPWDVAAPSLICKQVGLFIGTYGGSSFDVFAKESLLVSPKSLKKELIAHLNS